MLNSIKTTILLSELYRVMASCTYNHVSLYCAVLIEIKDEIAKKRNGVEKPYLLQVWNKKGTMLFERALRQPVANWNMANDFLMF